jgi:hypothetical protein
VDAQIQDAVARGQFDDLPGRGRPLADLTNDPDWWVKSKLRQEGISFLPASLELRREVQALRERLCLVSSENDVRREVQELNARIRRANARVTSGPPSDLAPLDEEAEVARWRATRT